MAKGHLFDQRDSLTTGAALGLKWLPYRDLNPGKLDLESNSATYAPQWK